MGRNKIKIEKIKNERIRQVTFYKRKKGLLKKAMELGLLCDVKVFLCIVDKNDKSLLYSSDKDINKFINEYMLNPAKRKEIFTDQDVSNLFNCSIKQFMKRNQTMKAKVYASLMRRQKKLKVKGNRN
jgi:MADS-box transcription factor